MVILTALIARAHTYYFRGSANSYEWASNRALAAQYPDEQSALTDLSGSPAVYDHYTVRAKVSPA